MSFANFIPVLWNGEVLRALEKVQVAMQLCNRNYQGMVKGGGSVKINQIGPVNVNSYTKGVDITFQNLTFADQELVIDQQDYFAFDVNDIDAMQCANDGAARQAAMEEAAYNMRDTVDAAILGLYASAGIKGGSGDNALGTTTTPIDITADGNGTTTKASVFCATINDRLDQGSVPEEMRKLIVPTWFHKKLLIENWTNSNADIRVDNGRVRSAFGVQIFTSNNIATTSSTKYHILGGSNKAITFADQIEETEAGRHEKGFSDYIKGLHVYGYKVVRADCLLEAVVTQGAEA